MGCLEQAQSPYVESQHRAPAGAFHALSARQRLTPDEPSRRSGSVPPPDFPGADGAVSSSAAGQAAPGRGLGEQGSKRQTEPEETRIPPLTGRTCLARWHLRPCSWSATSTRGGGRAAAGGAGWRERCREMEPGAGRGTWEGKRFIFFSQGIHNIPQKIQFCRPVLVC